MAMAARARKLTARLVEKPWGRDVLPKVFPQNGGSRIGEIWFENEQIEADPLLMKYIFTSERLSIQVHPNDEQARALGHPHGKNECWYILEAEPGAVLGLGLKEPLERQILRAAALDGSIEDRIDWRPTRAGDIIYVPAGTIHAIGAGISLLEVQQNIDVTYRLYDYGRPRELHLDEGLRVAKPLPYPDDFASHSPGQDSRVLLSAAPFSLLRLNGSAEEAAVLIGRNRWAMPLDGSAESGSEIAGPGECLFIPPGEPLAMEEGSLVLLAAAGPIS